MGGSVAYRLYHDGKSAGRDLYTMVQTITVEQGMDLATEARIELEMCANEKGAWTGPTEEYARAWKRIRVEIKNMTDEWVALIDGPIVAWDASMSGEPGRSTLTLVARDDSVYLNVETKLRKYEGKSDDEIARDLFDIDQIKEVDIDKFPARPPGVQLKIMRTCTQIELLHELALPYARHVFVRPGRTPGTSIGCVKDFVTKREPSLPALVLVGPKRNIESFNVRSDAAAGTVHIGANLDIEKVTSKTYTASWTDVKLLGDEDPFADPVVPEKIEQIDPLEAAFYDALEIAEARQEKASFVLVGRGSVRAGCYRGVLTAYDIVGVSGVNQKLCTNWLIRDVTHTLGRSEYRQDFTLIGNAVAKVGRDLRGQLPRPF